MSKNRNPFLNGHSRRDRRSERILLERINQQMVKNFYRCEDQNVLSLLGSKERFARARVGLPSRKEDAKEITLMLDANIEKPTYDYLAAVGFRLRHVNDWDPKAFDEDILAMSIHRQWILITHDHDFIEKSYRFNFTDSPGIVVLPTRHPSGRDKTNNMQASMFIKRLSKNGSNHAAILTPALRGALQHFSGDLKVIKNYLQGKLVHYSEIGGLFVRSTTNVPHPYAPRIILKTTYPIAGLN